MVVKTCSDCGGEFPGCHQVMVAEDDGRVGRIYDTETGPTFIECPTLYDFPLAEGVPEKYLWRRVAVDEALLPSNAEGRCTRCGRVALEHAFNEESEECWWSEALQQMQYRRRKCTTMPDYLTRRGKLEKL